MVLEAQTDETQMVVILNLILGLQKLFKFGLNSEGLYNRTDLRGAKSNYHENLLDCSEWIFKVRNNFWFFLLSGTFYF